MNRKMKFAGIFITMIGSMLLITGVFWPQTILPAVTPDRSEFSDSDSFFDEETDILEGRIALPSVAWSSMSGGIDIEDFRPEDLDPEWREIKVRSDGIYESYSGDFLFESEMDFFENRESSFPTGGVDKVDYEIFNEYLDRNVTARFEGTSIVLGEEGFSYGVDVDREKINGEEIISEMMPGGGLASSETEDFSEYLYGSGSASFLSDRSRFILDPRTSIPLDIELDIEVELRLPDTTRLTVREIDVRYAEETIWIESSSGTGRREEKEVITETRTLGRIDPDDDNRGIYDRLIIHYDAQTGERISSGEYDDKETFVVDRTTYNYITGEMGTVRSGYFEFPIGRVKEIDYPMWDEFSLTEGIAEYKGRDTRNDMDVMVFQMISEDVVVDSGNAVLPIYPHPATKYLLDTIQHWYLDERTGFMIDFHLYGTVKVASSGPLGIIETEVTTFEVSLPENTTSELKMVSDLFNDLVIPLSNKEILAFGLEISFTDEVSGQFVDLSRTVGRILDVTEIWIPRILLISGIVLLLITIILIVYNRREKTNTNPVYQV